MEPFLIMFKLAVEDTGLGVVRACADDVCIDIKHFSTLIEGVKFLSIAQQVAGLALKTKKCF